jgi:phage tail sheath protein FI
MAGLAARSDTTADPWFSPAGLTRGNVKNVTKLAWNPKQLDRDNIYKLGINPVVQFQGGGTVLYGDKTLLDRPSAFDRINVRRLFIVLEKTISRTARTQLFEFNDDFTQSQFRNIVEPFLRDVKARRGVTDYRVVCDSSNNTDAVIEQNRFVGDIYIKPSRSINFIQLNFVAVSNSVSFQEVTGAI